MSRRVTDPHAYTKLVWAQYEIRRVLKRITPAVAPNVASKLRRLSRSIDGAVRNAERFKESKTNAHAN